MGLCPAADRGRGPLAEHRFFLFPITIGDEFFIELCPALGIHPAPELESRCPFGLCLTNTCFHGVFLPGIIHEKAGRYRLPTGGTRSN